MNASSRRFIIASILFLAAIVCLWQMRSPSDHNTINVLDYGAVGDGITDDTSAFTKAFAEAAQRNLPLTVPKRSYVISQPLAISSGMILRFDGAELKHTKKDGALLSAIYANDWVIQGPVTLTGSRNAAHPEGTETGLFISGCSHYIVDKVTVQHFAGTGIEIDAGALSWDKRGDHGQFAFVSFINNHLGLKINEGIGAEYNLFTLLSFSGNEVATSIAGGSNIISVANIVDNDNGVLLQGGANHGKGIVNAANINHNKGFNVKAAEVTNGYGFNSCNIYGDGVTQGIIQLTDSKGIHVVGGVLDAAIISDGGAFNSISNSYIAGTLFNVSGTSISAILTQNLYSQYQTLNQPQSSGK